jgi:hypothetical protein
MSHSVKWIAKGRKRSNPGDPRVPIDIQESDKRVRRHPNDPPYGTAIDTPLAIELIRNLWQAIDADQLLTLKAQYKNLINQLSEEKEPTEKKGYNKDIEAQIEKLVIKNAQWLEDLIKHSFALTADKNLMLKMLSQPGCEGLRFYLCMKKEKDAQTLSLVSVGVDINARDLNYDYDKDKHELTAIPDIENCSLNGEYLHSPGIDPFNQGTTSEDDIQPYVLLKYANFKFKYTKT